MKIKTAIVSAVAAGVALAGTIINPAQAATYYWANTGVTLGCVRVKFTDNTYRNMCALSSTTKNVKSFQWRSGYHVEAYVNETQTRLFKGWNCGPTREQSFTSQTDSSRHVIVRVSGSGSCA